MDGCNVGYIHSRKQQRLIEAFEQPFELYRTPLLRYSTVVVVGSSACFPITKLPAPIKDSFTDTEHHEDERQCRIRATS